MSRLAIVTTHPIQYNAPLFRLLSGQGGVDIKVFYTWSQTSAGAKYDPKFGKVISWDIPLLEGYAYEFVDNVSGDPGSHHFRGIRNPGLISRISDWSPTAILVFGWSFQSHLACLRHFKGRIPVMFRGDSTLTDERPGIKSHLRHLFLSWVYSHIDIALYAGQANRAYFNACGIGDRQLVFAPHAVDNDRFGASEESREAEAASMRASMGIQSSDLVVMFAGKFEAKKDPHCLLRLAGRISDPNIIFLLVGNGVLEPSLKSAALHDRRIRFLDFQNQQTMPVIYRMADLFMLPSIRNETWGLAINEAMACKRPVIVSTKVGCAADLVIEGETGWTFEPGSAGEGKIAVLIEKLNRDPLIRKRAGEQAWRTVQSFSYDAIVKAIKESLSVGNRNHSLTMA